MDKYILCICYKYDEIQILFFFCKIRKNYNYIDGRCNICKYYYYIYYSIYV